MHRRRRLFAALTAGLSLAPRAAASAPAWAEIDLDDRPPALAARLSPRRGSSGALRLGARWRRWVRPSGTAGQDVQVWLRLDLAALLRGARPVSTPRPETQRRRACDALVVVASHRDPVRQAVRRAARGARWRALGCDGGAK